MTFRSSLLALSAAAALAGCSTSPVSSTRSLRGQVDVDAYALDNAKIIAHGSDGRRFFAALDQAGRFAVVLPTGVSYRLAIANTAGDGSSREIAQVGWPDGGSRSHIVKLMGGASVDLGLIRPFSGSSLAPLSHGSDDSTDSDGAVSDDSTTETEMEHCGGAGEADLPYDVRPAVGQTFKLDDAFLARGPLPASIVSVTMDGGDWRLAELQADTAFTITQADCDHLGNRDVGRDRIFVTWKNADGSTQTDHLDMRYCDGGSGSSSGSTTSTSTTVSSCEDDSTSVCGEEQQVESECEHGSAGMEVGDDDAASPAEACSPADTGTKPASPSSVDPTGAGAMGACIVSLDCETGFQCVQNRCEAIIL
jgi:hypothetical protein